MREFSLPPLVETLRSGGLADAVYEGAARDPGLPQAACDSGTGGPWHTVTAAGFRDRVLALAKGLYAEGVRFGDPVALMARTCFEWPLFSHALWSLGAHLVPIYPTSSPDQVRRILWNSRARGWWWRTNARHDARLGMR